MNFELRPFQKEDIPFFTSNQKSCVWYEPRLGKTVVTSWVLAQTMPKTVLIVCPKNALFVWRDHLQAITAQLQPDKLVKVSLVRGDAIDRKMIWDDYFINKTPPRPVMQVFVITWSALLRDFAYILSQRFVFEAVIGDEYQRVLKSRRNQTMEMMTDIVDNAFRFHPLSGTPAGRGKPQQFWPVLRLCSSRKFGSYWKFVEDHCDVGIDGMGHQHIIGVKRPDSFRLEVLDPWGRVRLRKEVAPQMPEVQRSLLHIDMTPQQAHAYEAIRGDRYFWARDEDGKLVVAATTMEEILRARQILACPAILDNSLGVGAAMHHILDLLEDSETEMDRHMVIFCPFTQALPHFEKFLKENGFNNVWTLKGGIEPEELHNKIDKFARTKGIILCSTMYAQAFSLAGPEQCFHIGYSWDPDDNKQAEDRLIPQEGKNPIISQYFSLNTTIDESLAEAVTIKQQGIDIMLGIKR